MNLRSKMNDALSQVRQIEGTYVDRVKGNSKNMDDYLEANYFSGLRNGIAFVMHTLNNPVEEKEFDTMLKEVLHQEAVN